MYDDTVMVDKAYYNKLKEQTTWISVKDRLPELYVDVLVYTKGGIITIDYLAECMMKRFHNHRDYVTHWMPLPKPPESEGD